MRLRYFGRKGIAVALSMCTTTAFAAGHGCGRNFVDADGDGICDNACVYTDADGDGICDNCGIDHWCGMAGDGCGRNFVDANGDGVCDNYTTGQGCGIGQDDSVQESGYGRGCHGRCGNGFRGGQGR